MARRTALLRRLAPVQSASLVRTEPSAQTAVDAVPDAWASRLPPPFEHVRAGEAELFEDGRISWGFDRLGGVVDRTVLELGPLEGGHSYMAQQAGARSVTAIEMNSKAFLKCLVVKDLLGLDRCTFQCGDALEYLANETAEFDLCIACGILYHMIEPIRLIDLVSQRSKRILIWTHIYDDAALANRRLSKRLGPAQEMSYDGFAYRSHQHRYRFDTRLSGFCGGSQPFSNWLPRAELLRALDHFGWTSIEIAFDEPNHPNGPSLALTAIKG